MPKKHVNGRCPAEHNPGDWPYTERCVFNVQHEGDHQDRKGNRW